jgi:iron(III) transport system substrate-binding protein
MKPPATNEPCRILLRVWAVVFMVMLLVTIPSAFRLTQGPARVVAYVAQDQVYAEPIFKEFANQTGVRVWPVFDNEAVKTVGLANRLVAEKNHPQCDVFWGNEELRTRQLAQQGVFRGVNGWAAFGQRSRRLVINTKSVPISSAPKSFLELTNSTWRGRVAVAYPQFGTTAAHFHALRQLLGADTWAAWCRALAANKPLVVDGNSEVVKMVGRGEAVVGMTDSDDIAAGKAEGLPITELPLSSDSLLIPNTIGLMANAPHPLTAEKLFKFLQSPAVADILVKANALEGAETNAPGTSTLKPDWSKLLADLDATTAELNRIFLR